MKLRLLSLAIFASISAHTYADSAQDQAKLSALQTQLTSLQNQVKQLDNSNINTPASPLSQWVMLDTSNPIGAMPYTSLPLTLLQAKSTLNAPLVIGGSLEADLQAWNGSFSTLANNGETYQKGTDLALTSANLFTMANINNWVTGFVSFQGNVGGGQNDAPVVDRAFFIIGNLQENPLFLTFGKTYLPFGLFQGNGAYANSLNTDAFRISQTNQIALNFYQDGLNTSLAAFNSKGNGSNINNFTYNIHYTHAISGWTYGLGAGYLNDIRGTNSGIGAAYPDSATSSPSIPSTHNINGPRNAAYDFNASLAYGEYSLVGQYDTTKDGATATNGEKLGRLSVWNVTASYAPTLWNIPMNFHIGYSATHNMGTIPFPLVGMVSQSVQTAGNGTNNSGMKNQWQLAFSGEVLNNVYLGPEFDYQHLYNSENTWAAVLDLMAYF